MQDKPETSQQHDGSADAGAAPLRAAPLGAAPAAPVGQRTASSFMWLATQTIGDRVVAAVGQVILAWLILPSDAELVALTYTVTTFAALLQQSGVRDVLVQRHDGIRLWGTPAFWLSLSLGLGAAMLAALAAPVAAAFYGRPQVAGLILVSAISLPLISLSTVPEAILRSRMRFDYIATVAMVMSIISMSTAVFLAWRGFGAYAFIVPQVVVAALRFPLLWIAARPPVRPKLHLNRWRFLVSDSARLLLAGFAMMTTFQGAFILLGWLYRDQPFAGLFYFAYMLTAQTSALLVYNLGGVLFPALRSLNAEPERQLAGFVRATRTLMLIGLPICVLQAILAGPFIRIVFPERWYDAIGLAAVLSFVMVGRLLFGPAESLLLAQRRQKAYLRLSLGYAAVFWAVMYVLAAGWGSMGAAWGMVACLGGMGIVTLRVALGRFGSWNDVLTVTLAPTLASLAAFVPAAGLAMLFPATPGGDIAAILVVGATGTALYGIAIRVLAPRDVEDLLLRIGLLLRRGRSAGAINPAPPATASDARG